MTPLIEAQLMHYEDDYTYLFSASGTQFYTRYGKRIFDLALGLALLPLLAPIIAILIILVRLDGGPGLFSHSRIGRGGRRFRCWKIRTMVPDAGLRLNDLLANDPLAALDWARARKLDNDPRTTRIGRLLRRTSLDELPQIINVLQGDMSFVGPRPITAEELAFYQSDTASYLSQTPGITGLWQIKGRHDGCFRARVAFDRRYRVQMCFMIDLLLILHTASLILLPTGR